ncbi:RNA-directed DNA polymerase from mobile element jockey-like [Brachionus plicatilis]|uniref:RNA-directed DNA polymerase from mobile element jockey-like n=1 Tax=Brachionus plicatilis TaxID=10195 RepID=A0A3M7T2R0_BRAPC|nr:RNA-directed DNA polymerase from mobile element jockey-like [Brachionus plicatilis]
MDGDYSTAFKTTAGVRQGGKASPKLFSLYIEEILIDITKSESGIKLSTVKIDVIAYADDLLLISQTKKVLQSLLEIVTYHGTKLEIKFNPSKTVYIIFSCKKTRTAADRRDDWWQDELTLEREKIRRVTSMKYLGVEFNEQNSDQNHLEARKRAALGALARLKNLEILTENTCPFLKGYLYKTYILPVLIYGMEPICLTKTNMNAVTRLDNNLLRYVQTMQKN